MWRQFNVKTHSRSNLGYRFVSQSPCAGVLTVLMLRISVDLFAIESRVQTCFIINMLVFNRLDVTNICGTSLCYGALLTHNHPDGVVTA